MPQIIASIRIQMNTQEKIEKLERELKKLKESLNKEIEFIEVKKSEEDFVLLKDLNGNDLVQTWSSERNLNDFEYFKKYNSGNFLIYGNINKFEIRINGEWIECSEIAPVRFLK